MTDGSTLNLRVIYYSDGKLQNAIIPSDKGAFAFTGKISQPTIIEILANDYSPFARIYAAPGDELEVSVNPKSINLTKVKGNDIAERWTSFLNANAKTFDGRDVTKANALIAKYINEHREDVVSTLLLLTTYDRATDPVAAEKLLTSIAADARPAYLVDAYSYSLTRVADNAAKFKAVPFSYLDEHDSIADFNPRKQRVALLAFSTENSGRTDSITPKLRELHKSNKLGDKLRIIDFSLDNDTLTWRRQVRADSTSFDHGWVAGSVAAPAIARFGIPRIPFFIVIDSVGKQIYRGPSINAACKTIEKFK